MPSPAQSAAALKPLLEECGYTGARLEPDFKFGSMTIPLVGFATKPWDFDSACIAVVDGNGQPEIAARSCRNLGAPVVWVRHNGQVDWWMQHDSAPTLFASKPVGEFPTLVRRHKEALGPLSVYRGKTIARVVKSRQLDFVDAGLLPLLREEAGKKLHDLVEAMIRATLTGLSQSNPSRAILREVFTAVFRMLAGKILKDKGVHGFKGLDLTDPGVVLSAVAKHYSAGQTTPFQGKWKTALTSATSLFSGAGSFGVVSPEALAYVYEHTMVSKALRKKLGIHATPPWLVDYMVWELYDWICEIPVDDRHVFEPACGHAPFLLSAMRLLRLEMPDQTETKVHAYLQNHIHGLEIDDFAREIARLSLTLADIPNPNGWDLQPGDMFASDALTQEASRCRILLSNPPYERFTDAEMKNYDAAVRPKHRGKAVELMQRSLAALQGSAVFGLVLPQGVLHSAEARSARELLLRDFDVREICLFADKVFEEGEPESVILLGRHRPIRESVAGNVRYRRVRESGVKRFALTYEPDSELIVETNRFETAPDKSFRVPDLLDVWVALRDYPVLSSVADVGQGFSFARKGLIEEARRLGTRKTADAVRAFLYGHSDTNIWELPLSSWLSPTRTPVRPWRSGDATGKPQVLVNYVRAMRGPWRIKAFLDHSGHAAINTYFTVRPKRDGPPIEFFWAILNSPLANAYAYCNTMQKHIYDGLIAALPLPMRWETHVRPIVDAATSYLKAVKPPDGFALQADDNTVAREALLSMDAAVMRAYGLPVRFERAVLDLFRLPPLRKAARRRKGVGCVFGDYYPADFKSLVPLYKYISASYRSSIVDAVARRIKPSESSVGTAALRAAARAFGGEE